ncbi:MAG: dTMP kinase, partial [Gemmataceae bacterium]
MDRGILIAVDGIDGAGKTTQVQLLADSLKHLGLEVVTSKEPTSGHWGEKIRRSAVTGRMNLEDELHAFVEDRKEHVRELINPSLQAGKVVILDRYYFSTIAYQGSRGADADAIAQSMRSIAPEPDATIILDVPAEVGFQRIAQRDGTANCFENLENLQAVRVAFLSLARNGVLIVIDGTPLKLIVHRIICKQLFVGVR